MCPLKRFAYRSVLGLLLLSLAACNAFAPAAPTALPTVVLDAPPAGSGTPRPADGQGIVASGVVAPAQSAKIVFASGGRVKDVLAEVGDSVSAGQTLVQLEGLESLEAAVSQAQFELAQAQQALKDLSSAAELGRVQAMQAIVTYEKAVKDARYALDNFTTPVDQAGMEAVAALNAAKQRLDEASAAFEPYKYASSNDPQREARKEQLDEAQAAYNAAFKRLQYEYDLQVAQANLDRAQRDYAILSAGADPDQVRLAEARQANAESQLAAAEAALGNLSLTAPFDGVISTLNAHPGEWVIPGQPILTLADLAHLRIETTDLSERDVPAVQLGQTVRVRVKALGTELPGTLIEIAPIATTLGGDVVYQAIIVLEVIPPELRAGMSVEVQF